MKPDVEFPLTITFEDGSVEQFDSIESLEQDLEDFDSDLDVECRITDRLGRPVKLKLKMLEMKELSLLRPS